MALIAGLVGGCDFSTTLTPVDAPKDIDAPDAPGTLPASCKALHDAQPNLPDTTYSIDPDGNGPDAPLMVSCDMSTEGGGWTIVFVASSSNLTVLANYTVSTTRLLADAQSVLLAYRNGLAVNGSIASLPMPAAWRTGAPFSYPGTDLTTNVSVNGGVPMARTLRYGFDNFNTRCQDAWDGASKLGRICVDGTQAPFFNGFYSAVADNCGDSLGVWNSVACTDQLRFSIAVR
jgi:hypothetical protein